ncbi:major facilitator superfamily domain-containing protein [Cercophora newfieldiana]|uniref:Major facilitator superfamily domain-containing protein n=1 Tax=Cercophora newfieldiana TaxID=92897 RepID=A0AA39YPP5_9PEZI|nr:major facilitator superfamily domain-containing protein [Cercophora newfieldiana]
MTDREVETEAAENRPLLDRAPSPARADGNGSLNGSGSGGHHWLRLVLIISSIDLIINSTAQITLVPSTAILQDIVCNKYYASARLDPFISFEDRCKVEPVQSEVAYINAWRDSFEMLVAVTLAIPYGALADRVGRKFVFLLAVIGCLLSDVWIRAVYWFPEVFPLRMVWLSGIFQAIGGGGATLGSIGMVLIADACPPGKITTAFSYVSAGLIASKLVGVPFGASFQNPWVPMWISSAVMVIGFFLAAALIPESRQTPAGSSSPDESQSSDEEDDNLKLTLRNRLLNIISAAGAVTRWVASHPHIIPPMLGFFFFQAGEAANGTLLLQYAAKRLGLTLSEASYLLSLSAATHLLVLTLFIPLLSSFLLRTLHLQDSVKDQRLSQIFAVFLVLGTSLVALTSHVFLFTIGWVIASLGLAFTVPTRSVVTNMVEKEHLAVLYTGISVFLYGGLLVGGPAVAALFKLGMRLGGVWLGLPFLVATGCFVLCLGGVSVWRGETKGSEEEGLLGGE